MSYKIGISTCWFQLLYGHKEAIKIAKDLGVDAVDFFTNSFSVADAESIYSKSDEEIIEYFTEIREYAKELGICFSQTHGRLRIYMNDPALNDSCLENARRDLLAASVLGAPVCVMHGVTTSVMGPDADPQLMRDLCYDIFNKILVWAKEYNVKLATETTGFLTNLSCLDFFANADELKNIFERIESKADNSEYFTICVDTGHSNLPVRFGNPSVGDVIRMLGKNISCLHIHDNDGITDQHKPPLTGTIDWDDVFDALEEIGYDGVYNLEVNPSVFGEGFELETTDFSVKLLKYALNNRKDKKHHSGGNI